MGYRATMLADSVTEQGDRLTTMEVEFPRFVLAEFNTHRMFSRNSASSRAIPAKTMIDRVLEDPFVPEYWGENQPGMQADQQIDDDKKQIAKEAWYGALDDAVYQAQTLIRLGTHKQLVNRLLEPFMWHTVIVTATEWSNFFALRAHEDAQPEIRTIATMMQELYGKHQPQLICRHEWHMPLIQPEEYDGAFEFTEDARKVSAARCARVSYLTHDGRRDIQADLRLYDRLVAGGHMSPLEHVATPYLYLPDNIVTRSRMYANVTSWAPNSLRSGTASRSRWSGNFRGWKQFRKFVPDEQDYSLVAKEHG